jgi:hypothetical protein
MPVLGQDRDGPHEPTAITRDGVVYTPQFKLFKLDRSFTFDIDKHC